MCSLSLSAFTCRVINVQCVCAHVCARVCARVCVRVCGEVQDQTDSFNCVFLSAEVCKRLCLSLIYLSFSLPNPHNEGGNSVIKAVVVSLCVCRTSRRRSRLIMMSSRVWMGIRWRWWRLWGAQRKRFSSNRDWMIWTSAGTTWSPNQLIYGQSHTHTSSSSAHITFKNHQARVT